MDSYAINQEPPINMNYASAQEHVPRAERNNRTIKEQQTSKEVKLFPSATWGVKTLQSLHDITS
eukprot:8894463-Ditylum_brightwellii.AAC.1